MSMTATKIDTSFEIKRDFLFSTIMDGFYGMPVSSCMNEAQKTYWSNLLQGTKKLLGDDKTLQSIFNDAEQGKEFDLDLITGGHSLNNDFFKTAIGKTLKPSDSLLIRNRFLVLLDERIESLPDNDILKMSLSFSTRYFGDDAITPQDINTAITNVLFITNMQYYQDSIPPRAALTQVMFGLLDKAVEAHHNAPQERVVSHKYTPERLAALRFNA